MKDERKIRSIIFISLIAVLIGIVSVKIFILPVTVYSYSERRVLNKVPRITSDNLKSGYFMRSFESAASDQFPFRDGMRKLTAFVSTHILGKQDYHGYFERDGYLFKFDTRISEPEHIEANIKEINTVYRKYLKDSECKIYLSVIPDRNYFLKGKNVPLCDYEKMISDIREEICFAQYIDIVTLLKIEDYYKTDQHWKQECLVPVAEKITDAMNVKAGHDFYEKELAEPFYGTYYGHACKDVKPDTVRYLTSECIEHLQVTSYNTGEAKPSFVYDMKKASGKDPYEMFLGGSDALLTIDNPMAKSERNLVVFRDSFGSSLVPLMAESYSKITLVDLRYIGEKNLPEYITFENQDVLFLYSTLRFNIVPR